MLFRMLEKHPAKNHKRVAEAYGEAIGTMLLALRRAGFDVASVVMQDDRVEFVARDGEVTHLAFRRHP